MSIKKTQLIPSPNFGICDILIESSPFGLRIITIIVGIVVNQVLEGNQVLSSLPLISKVRTPKNEVIFTKRKPWNWHQLGQESSPFDRTKFAVNVDDSCRKVAIPLKLNLKLKSES